MAATKPYEIYHIINDQNNFDAERLQFESVKHGCFICEYDFTDGWQHQVRVEVTLAPEPHRRYPVCIDGRQACPPEDCGGPWTFMELRQHYNHFHIMQM